MYSLFALLFKKSYWLMMLRASTWSEAWRSLKRVHKDSRARQHLRHFLWLLIIPILCFAYLCLLAGTRALYVVPFIFLIIWLRNRHRRKNSATGNGGAIDNEYGASVQGSTFRQNNAADGGALYNGDRISVTNSTFVQNKASDGGAIAQQNNGFGIDPALSITGSQILRNQATQYGGGISSAPSIVPPGLLPGPTTITTTTIRGNKAGTDGGGIEDTALRPITLTQSSVVGNHPDNCAPPQSVSGCVN